MDHPSTTADIDEICMIDREAYPRLPQEPTEAHGEKIRLFAEGGFRIETAMPLAKFKACGDKARYVGHDLN